MRGEVRGWYICVHVILCARNRSNSYIFFNSFSIKTFEMEIVHGTNRFS